MSYSPTSAADAPRGSAWRMKEEMYKVLAKPEFHVHGKPLRVNVEVNPANKDASKLMRRALGALRGLGANNDHMKPAWHPTSIKSLVSGRPVTAFVYEGGAWRISQKGKAELMPNVQDDAVLAALNSS